MKKNYVCERYLHQYPDANIEDFERDYKKYKNIKIFKPDGNVFEDSNGITDRVHFIMRNTTGWYLTKAFEAMKIDLTDPNVAEDLESGNIGTPQRIAKVLCGCGVHDNMELGSGRWSKKPRIASFPNKDIANQDIPITKKIDLVSNCSHHFISFNSLSSSDSYAVISYIPSKRVLGISKLQRITDWVAQRFWLQEDLTKTLYDEICAVAETESVYVGLFNIVHGCEKLRGAKASNGSFTSEYYGGKFKDSKLRDSVRL